MSGPEEGKIDTASVNNQSNVEKEEYTEVWESKILVARRTLGGKDRQESGKDNPWGELAEEEKKRGKTFWKWGARQEEFQNVAEETVRFEMLVPFGEKGQLTSVYTMRNSPEMK